MYDFTNFEIYGLEYRRYPRLQVKNPATNRYANIDSPLGKRIVNDATNNNPDLLKYTPFPFLQQVRQYQRPRRRQPAELKRIPFLLLGVNGRQIQGMSATDLYNQVHPFTGRIKINVSRGDGFEPIRDVKTIFKDTDSVLDYQDLVKLLLSFLFHRMDYEDDTPIVLQVVQLPLKNPPMIGFRDGVYNCACLPVLEHLQGLKTPRAASRIKAVTALNNKYLDQGIDDEGMQALAAAANVNIKAIDSSRAVWRVFSSGKNTKTLIYYAHEKHFKRILVAEEGDIDFIRIRDQEVQWLPRGYDFTDLNSKHIEACRIESKFGQVALITDTKIYKTHFPEWEAYKDCYTSGGVGKAKFLEQVPYMKAGLAASDPFYKIYFDADMSGFYHQYGASSKMNTKFDHNHSYKSFESSPAHFAGFPILDSIFKINKKASETDLSYPGLVYIEVPTLTYKDMTKPLYYECSNWYPAEIVKYFLKYAVDPLIKCYATASKTFSVDFSKFTNEQFRCFIGKCSSKQSSSTWRTSDKFEFLRGLYSLNEKIIGTKQWGNIFEIEYQTDKTPWQLPVISAYVKAHQKVILFEQYNTLINNGIAPVAVRVDGIEVSRSDSAAAQVHFDIGKNPGQWKIEPVSGDCDVPDFDMLRYNPRDPPACPPTANMINFTPISRLTHYAGAGGNGKTHKMLELYRAKPNMCICVPENDLSCDIVARAKKQGLNIEVSTYHKVFGIGCRANIPDTTTFAFDECSKMGEDVLLLIDAALKKHFDNDLSFGGCTILLFGDFYQLPPVSLAEDPQSPLYNTWTGKKSALYELFTRVELAKNWRQDADPAFFALCNRLRTGHDNAMGKDEALDVIEMLNTRVVPAHDVVATDTLDDMYICGTNAQCHEVNGKWNAPVGTKVICQVNCRDLDKNKVANGKIGIVVLNEPLDFRVQWAEGISRFRSAGQVKNGKSRFKMATAVTVHKSQGKTLKRNVVINPTRLFERNHLYVALTRATRFNNVFLTEPITFRQFAKTVFVSGYSRAAVSCRLSRMVKKYIEEEPRLTVGLLTQMRVAQFNKCCYCNISMCDSFGYDSSITLERVCNDKPHILENIKLACFKCNSAHIGDE